MTLNTFPCTVDAIHSTGLNVVPCAELGTCDMSLTDDFGTFTCLVHAPMRRRCTGGIRNSDERTYDVPPIPLPATSVKLYGPIHQLREAKERRRKATRAHLRPIYSASPHWPRD